MSEKKTPTLYESKEDTKMSLEKRFWEKVEKRGEDECWLWKGAVANRYGFIADEAGRICKATHISLKIHSRMVPDGLCALHSCDTPLCVNPKHLWIGSQKENMQDMGQKGRAGRQLYPERYAHLRPPVMKGETNPQSKLEEKEVLEIREKYAKGQTQTKLAELYGVTQAMISLIINRKKWAHI